MRYLSGIQPSGELHLGNYFGAIKQHIELQDKGESFYFIANLHALTTLRDPQRLKSLTLQVAATYLALGLDPQKAVLFRQSDITEVTEFYWILSSVTSMGLLARAHSYKDKTSKGITPSVGLFTYPILMAADILLYRPDFVPVGADQLQHIEICNDIVKSFNAAYSDILKPCAPIKSPNQKVPGLDGEKMSKSYSNTIPIFVEGKKLRKIVGKIVTDSTDYKTNPLDPDKCNVFKIYSLFANESEIAAMRQSYVDDRDFGYGDAKITLSEKIEITFKESRERYQDLISRPQEIEAILEDGASRARKVAVETIEMVRDAVGISSTKSIERVSSDIIFTVRDSVTFNDDPDTLAATSIGAPINNEPGLGVEKTVLAPKKKKTKGPTLIKRIACKICNGSGKIEISPKQVRENWLERVWLVEGYLPNGGAIAECGDCLGTGFGDV